jgi:RNA polymerase sigma-70 factor (ECF subfamily)
MSKIEEQELIHRTLRGDQDAFESLYRRHFPRTWAIVSHRVWNREDVEDLVQTTFMQAYVGLEGFRGEAAFSTWLTQIALNVCASHRRSRQAWRSWLETVADPASEGRQGWEPRRPAGPEEALYRRECQALVRQAVEGLPDTCREAVRMRYVEDRSYAEIAQALQAPIGTVKTYLHRGRRQLKEHLHQTEGVGM